MPANMGEGLTITSSRGLPLVAATALPYMRWNRAIRGDPL